MVVLIAVNRHSPQQMCPQGVKVAFTGGEKQMGQGKLESGSVGDILEGGEGGSSMRSTVSLAWVGAVPAVIVALSN